MDMKKPPRRKKRANALMDGMFGAESDAPAEQDPVATPEDNDSFSDTISKKLRKFRLKGGR